MTPALIKQSLTQRKKKIEGLPYRWHVRGTKSKNLPIPNQGCWWEVSLLPAIPGCNLRRNPRGSPMMPGMFVNCKTGTLKWTESWGAISNGSNFSRSVHFFLKVLFNEKLIMITNSCIFGMSSGSFCMQ